MQAKRFDIVIIGAGNVAWHLGHQFKAAGHNIVQVYNRGIERGEELAVELNCENTNTLDGINKNADIYILAVSDHGIDDIILGLRLEGKVVAHTSGSVPLKGMEYISAECGIFYPLQTLTRRNPVSFKGVPIFIEAANENVTRILTELAESIGGKVYYLAGNKRRAVHVAAVFANNFTNYLYGISRQIMDREKLPFDMLFPLLQETLNKIKDNDPHEIQTGPARRADYKTIEEHLKYLAHREDQREVYLVLAECILNLYKDSSKVIEADDKLLEELIDEDFDFDELDEDSIL